MKNKLNTILTIVISIIMSIYIYLLINVNIFNELKFINVLIIVFYIIIFIYNIKLIFENNLIFKIIQSILLIIMLISMFNLSLKVLLMILSGKVTEKVEYSFFDSRDESIVIEKYEDTGNDGIFVINYKRYFGLGFSCNSEIYTVTDVDNVSLDDDNIKKAISEVANLKKYQRCFFKQDKKKYGFLNSNYK